MCIRDRPCIGVNVRYVQCLGRNVKHLCQRSGHVRFGRSGTILVLRKADICGFLRETQRHAKVFLRHAPHRAEKVDAFTTVSYTHLTPKGERRMDLFDIIGPVMVGPSSSHTAGAARIGKITRMPVSYTHLTVLVKAADIDYNESPVCEHCGKPFFTDVEDDGQDE